MYATRLLSTYKRNPSALSDPPPSGPNSSYLVLSDEEDGTSCCFGLGMDFRIKGFPLPQNKDLSISLIATASEMVDNSLGFVFLPVLDQPLSSNRYYIIARSGKNQGFVNPVQPRPLEPFNDYQQFELTKNGYCFKAKSIASDGIPPCMLSDYMGWHLYASTPHSYHLEQALGSNDSLRSKLPNFDFPMSNDRSKSVVVGKWYCPFIFVKERMKLKEQMEMSMFYELTLVQRWEKIFSKENENNGENNVLVDVAIQTEVAEVAGRKAVWYENRLVDGVLWFKSVEDVGKETSVGLRLEVVKAMKWEQERFGWIAGNGRQVKVTKVEEFGGTNKWKKFSCYVLVESFVLKRMNGSLVLTYDYRHLHQVRSKWE